jgi:hypothetical protein
MDRDAGQSDREQEARQGDTGMIGSEAEEPGPGRDTSLTDPDPAAASTDQPRGTVAMSEGDPMRTRLGSHVEGAGAIGYDVTAAEEGTTQQTPDEERPGYEPERPHGETAYGGGPGDRLDDAGSPDRSVVSDEPTVVVYEAETTVVDYQAQPGGAGLFGDEEDRLDRPGPQGEPGVDQGVFDQEADRARREHPSEGH